MSRKSQHSKKCHIVILWIMRALVLWLIAAVIFGVYAWIFAWRKLEAYTPSKSFNPEILDHVLDGKAYGERMDDHARPYLVELDFDDQGSVLVFGAEHTKNPKDPQLADIKSQWVSFNPSVALCESRLGTFFPGLMDPVKTFAEPGYVHHLARRKGIPTYTWEPPVSVQMNFLLQDFTQEQVALRYILGPYFSNLRFGRPEQPDQYLSEILRKRSNWPGIENTFQDIKELQASWSRHFPDGPDWRDVSDQYGLPGFMSKMDTNLIRDLHLVETILDLVERGERVFVIAGSSHAVKIEPALVIAAAEKGGD